MLPRRSRGSRAGRRGRPGPRPASAPGGHAGERMSQRDTLVHLFAGGYAPAAELAGGRVRGQAGAWAGRGRPSGVGKARRASRGQNGRRVPPLPSPLLTPRAASGVRSGLRAEVSRGSALRYLQRIPATRFPGAHPAPSGPGAVRGSATTRAFSAHCTLATSFSFSTAWLLSSIGGPGIYSFYFIIYHYF